MHHHQQTFNGWMMSVRVDSLTRGSNKTQFNLFFGKLDQLFFDPARWWWPEVTPFFAYSAKEGRKWITKQMALKKSIPHKWRNEIPPPPPPSGISSGTKLRHKKRRLSSGRSSIRQWWLMSGVVKSRWRLTKVAPIVALSRWNQWNIGSTVVHWLNTGGDTLPTSFGNSLPKKKNLGPRKSFSMMQCLFDQPLCKTLKRFSRIWFFLKKWSSVDHLAQQNDMVFNNLQWPIEKTRQVIWDALQDYGRIEWKQTLKDLEKTPDVAYQDVLNKFDLTWGVKNLIVTWSNLVVTWKDRPQMSIISWFPLGLRWFARVGCILVPSCNWIFNLCQIKKIKK